MTFVFLSPPLFAQSKDAGEQQLEAQRSKQGHRVKKKKDFFKSKSPLPSIKLPKGWDGWFSAGSKEKAKTKEKSARPPLPSKKQNLRRVKKTPKGFIYESQTYRKSDIQPKRGKLQGLGKPGFDLQALSAGQIVTLPLPRLKPKGFDLKKQTQLSQVKPEKATLKIAPHNKKGNEKGGKGQTPLDGKVSRAVVVVPPPPSFWEPKEIKEAQLVCQVLMKDIDATVTPIKPIRRGACGTPAPLKVKAVGQHRGPHALKINPGATLNCQITARLAKWAHEKLQPLAMKHLNSPVAMVHNVASYSCRHRYNDNTRKLSEHALANALDIAGFTLKNGTTVSVLKHWEEEGDLGAFLKAVHASACEDFVVVLGPEANEAHKDHFHFDLGRYKVCE